MGRQAAHSQFAIAGRDHRFVLRDFYNRDLRDWKGSADIDQMTPTGWTGAARCVTGRFRGPMPV
jgi:hypothetical protein